jgi:hypothetical protein
MHAYSLSLNLLGRSLSAATNSTLWLWVGGRGGGLSGKMFHQFTTIPVLFRKTFLPKIGASFESSAHTDEDPYRRHSLQFCYRRC